MAGLASWLSGWIARLPQTSTEPFCPTEIRATVPVAQGASLWARFRRYAGIGFLISVGYVDPGNWATDIEAGSRFGFGLLWVVLASSLIAMFLQTLCVRLGVATGKDIAQLCREQFSAPVNRALWAFAQIAIVACDFAEVLGTALALKLLTGLPLAFGVALTAFDTVIVLFLQGKGILNIEKIVASLLALITLCFAVEIVLSAPDWAAVSSGLIPRPSLFAQPGALMIAIGILGATVMPHNLYLHSSAVTTRAIDPTRDAKKDAVRLLSLDVCLTLTLAFFVNAAILVLAASAFHGNGLTTVAGIEDAHRLLTPLLGAGAAVLFGIALFASGQSSTFTGTIAGQVVLQGFLNLRIPCWKQRVMTRLSSVLPALLLISAYGEDHLGDLLVASQIILSLQLPFVAVPLLRFISDRKIVGDFALGLPLRVLFWGICLAIIAANLLLLWELAA